MCDCVPAWISTCVCIASLQVHLCVCVVYGVKEPGVCYSLYSHTVFHQAPSCSPQTLSIRFHSLGPPSAVARGWMISNTWEPWEPTQCWNNRGPVRIRALEEDETAGGDDVRIIHTHPHFLRPSWLSVTGTHAHIQKHPQVQKQKYRMTIHTHLP